MSLFQIRNCADKFRDALEGKAVPVADPATDPTTKAVAVKSGSVTRFSPAKTRHSWR
jgi:hypothetical protein